MEPEEKKDVTPEENVAGAGESAEEVKDVETPPETKDVETPAEEVKPEVKVDDRDLRNLYFEQKRKVDEMYNIVKNISQPQTTQQDTPKYTKAQLKAFAEEHPEHKVWAYEEIDKMEKEERRKEMSEIFSQYKTQTESDQKRHQAHAWVAQSFPEAFITDNEGNVVDWNPTSPLTRKIGEYMNNPKIAGDPEGIMVAAKLAAFDLGIVGSEKLKNKLSTATAQLRKEQKKQLPNSGGGTSPKEDSKSVRYAKLMEEYKKTRNSAVLREALKLKGVVPSEEQLKKGFGYSW